MKLIEARAAILAAKGSKELYDVIESFSLAAGFRFESDRSYDDNAIRAEGNLMFGMAELLKLAAKREKAWLC